MGLSVKFYGAAQEVGRSSFVVDAKDKILLDHGVKLTPQGPMYPGEIQENLSAAIVSHAHFDHSGNLPHLFDYNNCLIYLTPPTLDLSRLLWFDTLKIADFEGVAPKFEKSEIERVTKFSFPTRYRMPLQITENVLMELFDAGHILGSSMVKLNYSNKSLVYTGDFKLEQTRSFNGADLKGIKNCDYLIMETTYGNKEHEDRKEIEKVFFEKVQETIDKGGWALIPSFAIGRSQEVIQILFEKKLNGQVFFDGMGMKAARIFLDYPDYFRDFKLLKKSLSWAHWVEEKKVRKRVFKEPCAIVTTAGMLMGGPIYHYLPKFIKDKNSTIFLTGYQVEETPGRILKDTGKIPIEGSLEKVEAKVHFADFSAHAGHEELIKTVETLSPEKVICVHGDSKVISDYQTELKEKGFEAFAPKVGEIVKLL